MVEIKKKTHKMCEANESLPTLIFVYRNGQPHMTTCEFTPIVMMAWHLLRENKKLAK